MSLTMMKKQWLVWIGSLVTNMSSSTLLTSLILVLLTCSRSLLHQSDPHVSLSSEAVRCSLKLTGPDSALV